MSSPVPVSPNEGVGSSPSAAPVAESQSPSGSASASSYDSATKISSLNALKDKAPDVYESMMKGVAMTIVNEMHHSQEHLKETMRKARQDAGES